MILQKKNKFKKCQIILPYFVWIIKSFQLKLFDDLAIVNMFRLLLNIWSRFKGTLHFILNDLKELRHLDTIHIHKYADTRITSIKAIQKNLYDRLLYSLRRYFNFYVFNFKSTSIISIIKNCDKILHRMNFHVHIWIGMKYPFRLDAKVVKSCTSLHFG